MQFHGEITLLAMIKNMLMLFLSRCNGTIFSLQIVITVFDIKFQANPSSGSQGNTCRQANEQARSSSSVLFVTYANAPKKVYTSDI
jgi:hypothetical protein